MLHQQFDAGVQGSFGKLNGTHIVLGHRERYRASMHDIAESTAGLHDAVAARGELSIDYPVLVDDARQVHLGNDFDDSRAADARYAAGGGGEPGLIGPQVRADHLESGLQRSWIDPHALDRTGRGTLSATYLSAFESGSGWTRAGQQTVAITEHDLRVGADVDQQSQLIAQVRTLREDHAGGVRPNMSGYAGQHIN